MNMNSKPRWVVILGTIVCCFVLEWLAVGHVDPPCQVYEPHYGDWACAVPGATNSSGSLSSNNLTVCVGDAVTPPTLATAPTFSDGKMRRYVSSDCDQFTNQNHWETNTLSYLAGSLYFTPPIPSSFTTPTTNTYTAYVNATPTALLAWWPGDGNTNELVYSNDCVLQNGATYTNGVVGDGAFYLDGVDDYISVADSSYLNVGSNNNFSIECWIQAAGSRQVEPLVDKRGYMNGRYSGYILLLVNGKLGLFVYSSSGNDGFVASASPDLRDTNWHHVAVSVDRDAANGGKLYVNGQEVGTFNPTGVIGDLSNPGPLRLGYDDWNPANLFTGAMDEISLYQCALSADDIALIYSAGSAGKCCVNSPNICAPLPAGCVCGTVTNIVSQVTIQAIDCADPDGDGVVNWVEIAQGRNPNSPSLPGAVSDTANVIRLQVHTPLK
jgi:hypothetical protein